MDKLKTVLLASVASLAPLKAVLLVVFALVLVDLLTGVIASIKNHIKIQSNLLKRTVVKLLLYQLCCIMGYYVGLYLTGPELDMLKVVTGIIGITEVTSVLENLSAITGDNLFHRISGILSPPRSDDGSGGTSEGK